MVFVGEAAAWFCTVPGEQPSKHVAAQDAEAAAACASVGTFIEEWIYVPDCGSAAVLDTVIRAALYPAISPL